MKTSIKDSNTTKRNQIWVQIIFTYLPATTIVYTFPFRFCLFFHKTYCYIFLMFYNYTIFRLMRCLHVNRNLMTLYCLTKRCPNYLPVYIKVNYFLICVYLKCFCKLAIRKTIYVFVI